MNRQKYDGIIAKCQENGDTYDTKNYRYRFLMTGELVRCDIGIIGTTAGLDPNEWEVIVPEDKPKRPRTEAQAKAEAKYQAEHIRRVVVKLNRNTDADIIRFLEERQQLGYSVQGTLKDAIRYAFNDLHTEYTPKKD